MKLYMLDIVSQGALIDEMTDLVKKLNYYRDQYYNNNVSEISDLEYDNLFDKLKDLEERAGTQLSNSPTKTVGYTVTSKLSKVAHNHPMLSLDKTKSPEDILRFAGNNYIACMAKMDGLTCSLKYRDHKLVLAETRGDGHIGEDVTHNARVIENIPKRIPAKGEVIVDGEIIVCTDDFEDINSNIENEEDRYRHPRNYASGSIRQLDSKIASQRKLKFIAWKLVKGLDSESFEDRWKFLCANHFSPVPILNSMKVFSAKDVTLLTKTIKQYAADLHYPIDGCVFAYENISYGKSLGQTAHHPKDQIAFKFYDDIHTSKLVDIDWTIGKTGVLTPTAVFEPVEIDGTIVSRASLHNISIIKSLGLKLGCTVYVYKANQVIPQIDSCEQDGTEDIVAPAFCPICGSITEIVKENNSEVLMCTNSKCTGKQLAKFINFVSRKGADIQGLSEATLETFITNGYIKNYADIYHLSRYADEISKMEGFGKRSVDKLLESIENSRNIKLDKFINAVGIDGVGASSSKVIAQQFNNDYDTFIDALNNHYDFTHINGFGDSVNESIYTWYQSGADNLCEGLNNEFTFIKDENNQSDNKLSGLRFCITGTFSKSRDYLKSELEKHGAVFVSGVSKKLDILFAGENAGSKLTKANELGVKVADEEYLFSLLGSDEQPEQNKSEQETIKEINSQEFSQESLW